MTPVAPSVPPRFIGSFDFVNTTARSDSAPLRDTAQSDEIQARVNTSAVTDPVVGSAEKWVVYGEEACISVVRLYKPSGSGQPSPAFPALVLFGGMDAHGELDSLQAMLIQSLTRTHVVVLADVCGVGEAGAGYATFGQPTGPHNSDFGDYNLDHMPLMLGTSHVARHAEHVQRVVTFLQNRPDIKDVSLAAYNNLGSAVLHAVTAGPLSVARVALVSSIADYMSVGKARYYNMPRWMEMHGVLAQYDLPDLAALLAPRPLLVAMPTDEEGSPLSSAAAAAAYAFTASVYAGAGHAGQFTLLAGPPTDRAIVQAVLHWLKQT